MKVYTRYLFRQLAFPTLMAVLAFSGAIWLSQSLRLVDLIVNKGLPLGRFFHLTGLLFPSLLLIILPFAAFVGVIAAYQRLSAETELTALRSGGIGEMRLLVPVMQIAGITALVCYAISLYLLPWSHRQFKDLQHNIRNELSIGLLQQGVFTEVADGLTVYIRERRENGELHGVLVHDKREVGREVSMTAQRGFLLNGPQGPTLAARSGTLQERGGDGSVRVVDFEVSSMELIPSDAEVDSRWRKPKERFLHELLWPSDDPIDQENRARLIAEGHERLVWPLLPITLGVVAATAIILRRSPRRQSLSPVLGAVGVAMGSLGMTVAMINLAKSNLWFVPLIYIAVIGPILGSFCMVASNRLPRPQALGPVFGEAD
ncbi:MAG: LptF/LptG family permease [Geminicoccaceae bacterium]